MGRRGGGFGGGRIGGGGGRSGGFGGGGRIGGGLSGSGRMGGSGGGRTGRGLGAVGRAPTISRPPTMRRVSTPRPSSSRASGAVGFGAGLLAGSLLGGRRNSSRGFGGTSRVIHHHHGGGGGILPDGGNMGGTVQGGHRGFGGCGCFSGCFSIIVVIVILLVVMSMFSQCTSQNFTANAFSTNVTASTVSRTPLPQGSARETGPLYTDHLGWIRNPNVLLSGMRSFFNETGVRPHLYITDNINGNINPNLQQLRDFAELRYQELFEDQAHLLLVFFENERFAHTYAMYVVVGAQAQSVIDHEAQNILMDMVQRYYYTNLSEDDMFNRAFAAAGTRIMTVTRSPWIPVLMVVGVIIILVVLFMWWKNRQEQKRLEAEETERILSQPLETFNSTPSSETANRLAERYTDDK